MKENCKKKLFISGPITDTPFYWRTFEEARDFYEAEGYAVMNPAELPVGMSNADYARICLSMIDSADEVAFLPGWHESIGAKLEHDYCYYIRKSVRLFWDDVGNGGMDGLLKGLKVDREKCEKVADDRLKIFGKSTFEDKEIRIKIDASALPDLSDDAYAELFKAINNKLAEALSAVFDKAFTEGTETDETAEETFCVNDVSKKDAEVFSKLMSDTLCKAVDLGFSVSFSEDADGWRSVSLYAPCQPLYENTSREMDRAAAKEGVK